MMIKTNKNLFLGLIIILIGCQTNYTPKPKGYLRIDLPKKKYEKLQSGYPYTFEFPTYTIIKNDTTRLTEPYWINIEIPTLNCKIHITYKKVTKNLAGLTENSRALSYKHTIKADAIDESIVTRYNQNVFGTIYDIKGNAASSIQFHLTDSCCNFIRGSLYFYASPNYDSLAPAIDFVREDIFHLIETFEWVSKK